MEENTYVMIDGKTLEAHLGTAADEDPGEKVTIIDFLQEVNGKILPDWSQIDTFAASWR